MVNKQVGPNKKYFIPRQTFLHDRIWSCVVVCLYNDIGYEKSLYLVHNATKEVLQIFSITYNLNILA